MTPATPEVAAYCLDKLGPGKIENHSRWTCRITSTPSPEA
jgi:hypothetical protein